MNPIELNLFVAFCKTFIGQELTIIGGKSKFTLQNISENDFYYRVSPDNIRKQHIRYVKRVLDQYAKIQSINPGHYANITQNAAYTLALIKLYEKQNPQPQSV